MIVTVSSLNVYRNLRPQVTPGTQDSSNLYPHHPHSPVLVCIVEARCGHLLKKGNRVKGKGTSFLGKWPKICCSLFLTISCSGSPQGNLVNHVPRKERDLTNQPSIPPLPTTVFFREPLFQLSALHIPSFLNNLQLGHILINDLLWPSYLQIFFLWFQVIRWLGIAVELLIHRFQKICLQCIGKNRCQIRSQSTSV